MQYDFSTTQVHAHHVRLLKQLNRHGPQFSEEMDVQALFDDELIQPTKCSREKDIKEIEISDKGELYLQWRWEDTFRHRWPVYLSIAAFVFSVVSFVISLAL